MQIVEVVRGGVPFYNLHSAICTLHSRQRMSPPTRSNLIRGRRRLERVRKGIDLLTRKRRALVADLFRLASPAIEARSRVQERSAEAAGALQDAGAAHGLAGLQALGWPTRPVEVEVTLVESWGVTSGAVKRLTPVFEALAPEDTRAWLLPVDIKRTESINASYAVEVTLYAVLLAL